MAVEILWDDEKHIACMYDTTTDHAFGPVFSGPSANVEVGEFLDWLKDVHHDTSDARITGNGTDPRHYPADHLEELVREWCGLPTLGGAA